MAPPSAIAPSLEAADDTTGILIPDPLTLENFTSRREKAGFFKNGVAAAANWDQIKGDPSPSTSKSNKPLASKDWSNVISEESASRVHSRLKSAASYLANPGLISLGGGLPSSEYIPFESMSLRVPSVGHWSEPETISQGVDLTANKHDMATGKAAFDIAVAFNYSQGHGSPQLLRWAMEHTEIVHAPPYRDWQTTLTVGSTCALDMVFRMLGRRGTYILSEEYTFATAVECAAAQGMQTVGVAADDEGMLPDSLDRILSSWDSAAHNGAPKPFIVYTVPTGQNPTGATQSLVRRRAIYAVAQKHDLLLIEDEPYYFLQMQPYLGRDKPAPPPPKSHAEFLGSLVPGYLSLDTDGRVLRMDSFSKVIAPGSRVGWLTGPAQLIERFHRHADMSTQGACGFSVLALYKLLDEHWGHSGFLDWLVHLRMEYTRRRNALLSAVEAHLPQELVAWKPPMAGMFFWIRIDWRKHPRAAEWSVEQIEDAIFLRAVDLGSLLMKGSYFRTAPGDPKEGEDEGLFFRATYAAASEASIDEAVRRFGQALREEFGLVAAANGKNGH